MSYVRTSATNPKGGKKVKPEEVKQVRENLNLTHEEFARKIGATVRSVFRWESGETKVSPVFIKLIEQL
jgi:putative transcriptional regulator